MQGGGTVSGSQVVAAIASKTCCARVPERQCHHHQGQQIQHQIHRKGRSRYQEGGGGLRRGLGGKGGNGMSGAGVMARTSMISWASSSTTISGWPCLRASRSRCSSSAE